MARQPPDAETVLRRLVKHLRARAADTPGLEVGGRGTVADGDRPTDVETGVLVTYRPSGGRGEALLWISPRRGKLQVRGGERGARTELEDRFVLSLSERPVWGDTRFRDLGELAEALLALMEWRVEAVGVTPDRLRRTSPERASGAGRQRPVNPRPTPVMRGSVVDPERSEPVSG